MAQELKNPPAMQDTQETRVWSLGQENNLEEEMATHFSILTWKIPWTEVSGGLQPKGLQRIECNWATKHIKVSMSKKYRPFNSNYTTHPVTDLIEILALIPDWDWLCWYIIS